MKRERETTTEEKEGFRKKSRSHKQRKHGSGKKKNEPGDNKFNPNRIFIGQLSYKTTSDDVVEHFKGFGVNNIIVRLLTSKDTGKSRGIAFGELEDARQVAVALRAHHSRLQGRMINVERSCGGGRNGEKRKEKLKDLKEKQGICLKKETETMIKEILEGKEKKLVYSDFDEKTVQALGTFPRNVSKVIVEEFVTLDFTKVNSKPAYFMGLIKKYRRKLKNGEDFLPEQSNDQ